MKTYLRLSPPSEHSKSNLLFKFKTNSFIFAFSMASHIAFSEYSLNGSMLIFNVPEKITGSYLGHCKKYSSLLLRYFIYTWGIIVNFFLKSLIPIECISILSIF
jgi:hypothetical protein